MILNRLEIELDVIPHANKELKVAGIPDSIVESLKEFVQDVDSAIKEICIQLDKYPTKDAQEQRLKEFESKRKSIYDAIFSVIGKKSGSLSFTPAEYVEAIYIVTYQLNKHLGFTQDEVSTLLDLNKNMYSKLGMSPVADYMMQNTSYQYTLPTDKRKDFLNTILPYLGRISARVSNNYFLGVSNEIGIIANLPNTNKKTNTDSFKGRQFYCNIRDVKELYNWIYIESLTKNCRKVKERVAKLIDTEDIELSEDLLRHLIDWGIVIKEENLYQHDYVKFDLKYESYKEKVRNRQIWIDSMDDPDRDYSEVFVGNEDAYKNKKLVNKQELCKKEIDNLTKEIDGLSDYLVHAINISSLVTKDNLGVLDFIVNKYQERLSNFTPDLFEDMVAFCSMYMISQYFNQNGVSKESFDSFQEYVNSSNIDFYISRYVHSYVSVFKDGLDINDNTSLLEKLQALNNEISSKKDTRSVSTALIFIDTDSYTITSEQLAELIQVSKDFCFIVSSSEALDLQDLKEEILSTEENNYYVYSNMEDFYNE